MLRVTVINCQRMSLAGWAQHWQPQRRRDPRDTRTRPPTRVPRARCLAVSPPRPSTVIREQTYTRRKISAKRGYTVDSDRERFQKQRSPRHTLLADRYRIAGLNEPDQAVQEQGHICQHNDGGQLLKRMECTYRLVLGVGASRYADAPLSVQ